VPCAGLSAVSPTPSLSTAALWASQYDGKFPLSSGGRGPTLRGHAKSFRTCSVSPPFLPVHARRVARRGVARRPIALRRRRQAELESRRRANRFERALQLRQQPDERGRSPEQLRADRRQRPGAAHAAGGGVAGRAAGVDQRQERRVQGRGRVTRGGVEEVAQVRLDGSREGIPREV